MNCEKCGSPIKTSSTFCKRCGYKVSDVHDYKVNSERNCFISGLIGFIVPAFGIILFLVWKTQRPKVAKIVGISALVSTAIGFISSCLIYLLIR